MQNNGSQAPEPVTGHPSVGPHKRERGVWIYTGYAAAVLGLLGVMVYHFGTYVLR